MFKSKYSNFLTIVLVVALIAILAIATIVVVNVYKKHKNDSDAIKAIEKLDNNIGNEDTSDGNTANGEGFVEQNVVASSKDNTSIQTGKTRNVTYYPNTKFVMIGYIEIPKINIKYPVLEQETVASLEKSVAVRYPSYAKLNQKGNVVIAGHNYRNGQFFSNLKNVTVGDTIKMTDENGQTLTYTVYEVYETTPEDTAYITRNVGDNIEVTLVTCTDNNNARIIVKAKV